MKQHDAAAELMYDKKYDIDKWDELPDLLSSNNDIYDETCGEADTCSDSEWKNYSERYKKLKCSGYFYRNLSQIKELCKKSTSSNEVILKLAMLGIDDKYFNYFCCYAIVSNKFFDYNWENLFKVSKKSKNAKQPTISRYMLDEYNLYCLVKQRYEEILKKNLEICSFNEFMNAKFN